MTAGEDGFVEAYCGRGVAVLRGALDPAVVAELAARSEAVWEQVVGDPAHAGKLLHRSSLRGGRVVDRADRYLALDPVLAALPARPELVVPTASLIGDPVWVLKDKLIRKEPGTDGYGPHQDLPYYAAAGRSSDQLVSLLIPLAPPAPDAGSLEVAIGSHRHLLTEPGSLDPAPDDVPVAGWELIEAGPGDLVFLHPLAVHRSGPNRSRGGRPIICITYGSGPDGPTAAAAVERFFEHHAKAQVDAGGSGEVAQR